MPILLACQFLATSSATIFLVRLVTNLALRLPLVTKQSKKTPLSIKYACLIYIVIRIACQFSATLSPLHQALFWLVIAPD